MHAAMRFTFRRAAWICWLIAMTGSARALPTPTFAKVPYGPAAEQILDVWLAEGRGPAPLVVCFHSGAWLGGDPAEVGIMGLEDFLKAGISVASVDFRTITAARKSGIEPPVKWPMDDAARALQFIRSKATQWRVDKTRIGAEGRSSGGTMALWLALHDEMADARSSDPVARESTRVLCAGTVDAQTTLDPAQMQKWIPNASYGGHAFGFFGPPGTDERRSPTADFDAFLAARDRIVPWIHEYSPVALVSRDDPPLYLYYGSVPAPVGKGQADPLHSAVFGLQLKEMLETMNVEVQVKYPGAPPTHDFDQVEFLIRLLKK